jgi:nucleotide-binding universal stress UspA family protein
MTGSIFMQRLSGPPGTPLFRKILFATDFSESCWAMVPQVQDMARRCNAQVILLHAFYAVHGYNLAECLSPASGPGVPVPYVEPVARIRDQNLKRLERLREQFAGLDCELVMDDGDPAAVIRKITEQEKADLIMMPTRGLGVFRRLVLGSVTAKVLHDVRCAVFTSAHELDSAISRPAGYRRIICAVEFNDEAFVVLQTAEAFAQMSGAHLAIVHIRQTRWTAPSDGKTDREINAFSRHIGIDAPVHVLDADVAAGIRRLALEDHADLVVVGRGNDQAAIARLWSDLYEIIRESPCPVLSV